VDRGRLSVWTYSGFGGRDQATGRPTLWDQGLARRFSSGADTRAVILTFGLTMTRMWVRQRVVCMGRSRLPPAVVASKKPP
jgi:hypothetical protein